MYVMFFFPPTLQSKPKLKGFISRLRDCRVKYKDPSEKMNDKQFILVDDEGTSSMCERGNAGEGGGGEE